MKRNFYYFLFLLSSALIGFNACNLDTCKDTKEYTKYTPIFIKLEDFRKDISSETARALKVPGKMYFYKNYLLINELREGIHVIDNSNPENPQTIAFLNIPGNLDMAIRNDVLYADSYADLVAVNIADIAHPKMVERRQNAFNGFQVDPTNGLVTSYIATKEKLVIDCSDPNWGRTWFQQNGNWFGTVDASFNGVLNNVPTKDVSSGSGGGGASNPNATGTQGSQSRFTLYENYLYTVNQGNMNVYDVSNRITDVKTLQTWWQTETIFPYGKALYVGTPSGLIIFDISNPADPKQASMVSHITGCDPVVVDGDKAYVTIRTGATCAGTLNLLEVFDVKNIYQPQRIAQFNMQNPHGLSVEGNNLYLCEGKFGLKVFDRVDYKNIDNNLLQHFKDFFAYDVIALPLNYPTQGKKIVMVIGEDGFVQYDATNQKDLKKLSTIKVQK
jgi:hypothetical protein